VHDSACSPVGGLVHGLHDLIDKPPLLSAERIAHLGTAGRCCTAPFQSAYVADGSFATKAIEALRPCMSASAQSGQVGRHRAKSASGQSRPNASEQMASLFDHLIGEREQRRRDFQAERFGGLHIDEEFKGCRQLDR
jgi:hypothetical protein